MAQRVLIGGMLAFTSTMFQSSQPSSLLGGSGFIGQNITKHFASKGWSVSHISRTPGPNHVLWKDIEAHGILLHYTFIVVL